MINAIRYHLPFIPALLMCMRALSMESTSQLSAQLPSQTQSQSPSPYIKQKQQIKTDLETAATILTKDTQDKQNKAESILQQALNSPNIYPDISSIYITYQSL